ncbi:uncharacterized protein TM35_000241260 [Trypanosoma theileri]|uniref:Uncharacterized protein n=1 Tax=Trypanosoma theileri TaxID=67003 RepID=A0A1X0NQH2_9TRYP|nr:uncharacterized protein TM35_000241260 [Trypanosoma theileri]ORC86976.1 hypothetical protein TM35_000241260 [Trypanosoma theileri]
MAAAVDGGTSRRTRHRAVAALSEIDAALTETALINSKYSDNVLLSHRTKPIVRYKNLEDMIQDNLRPDPHAATREALRVLQMVPVLRDEIALLEDDTLRNICLFLGERSRELAYFGSVCRRLRRIVIGLTPPVAVIAPDMIPLESLSQDRVADSLCAFFAPYKRGQFVQQLRLVDAKYASSLPINVVLPFCSPHLFPSLVKSLPSLTFLDLRGVQWDCHSNPNLLRYFFSDLYLVAPKLQTLKIGVELFSQWSPGWWQRLSALTQLVVGSRRDQAIAAGLTPKPAILQDEFFEMLRNPQRQWRVKLWCALERDALLKLLLPNQPFPDLQELTLNLSNVDILDEFKRSQIKSPRDAKTRKNGKKSIVQSNDEMDMRVMFPSLQALTLSNVDQCPQMAAELLERMTLRAPKFKYFTVVNTTRMPPLPKPKRRVLPTAT